MNYETVQNKIDTENINWDEIEKEIEQLYGVWSEVLIDLHQTNNNIVEFGKTIDETTKYIESKDKVNSLKMVAKLYNYLPMFMNDYKAQSKKIAYINTKSKIINAYSNIEEENWDEIKKQTSEAINEFNSILNDVQNNKNQYNVNKTYVLLNEFQNSIDTNDKKILYIKYKNLIQEMEEIKI